MSILQEYWTENGLMESIKSTYQHVIERAFHIDTLCQVADESVRETKAIQACHYNKPKAPNIKVRYSGVVAITTS